MDRGAIPADRPDMTASVKGDGTLAPRRTRARDPSRGRIVSGGACPSTESAGTVEESVTG